MTNAQLEDWQRQALLTEYQACQHESDSNSLSYWTMAGIFIGFSAVLLGAILYVITANTRIDAFILRTIVSAVGLGMILILLLLWFWLKRTLYLMDINYKRMREIELDLKIMWKGWRVNAIDRFNALHLNKCEILHDKQIDNIWNKLRQDKKFVKGLSEDYLKKLDQRKKELVQFCSLYPKQHCYERPSRHLHYPAILSILIGLWLFLALATWVPVWLSTTIVIIVFAVSFLIIKLIRKRDEA